MQSEEQQTLSPDLSGAMIKTIMLALDVLFKASGTDIRVHGLAHVPDQPVLYVVNHFTRMETIVMPYVIKKHIRKYPISLADPGLFTGRLGEIMNRGGAISTANPNRDAMLIRALLTDSHPVIIFPEGRMIKDKKIVEKGKYLIQSTTGRRPPHTGAGRIALRSQFIREELSLLRDRGDKAGIEAIARHFGFDAGDVDQIVKKETWIVPVNITYYPVRAKDNTISRLVNRFVQDVSIRMNEEMQVEGSMVMDGVDIDINLGLPLSVKKYLGEQPGIHDMVADPALYLDPDDLKHAPPFKEIYIRMMQEYMRAIYAMTTVNQDHLAAYLLAKYRKQTIVENDFKNRLYLAFDHLKSCDLTYYHQTLNTDQPHLISDDHHDKYESFMHDVEADDLIKRKDGLIVKNMERFSRVHEFHTIRHDNIIEVFKNEIEPLVSLTTRLNRLMLYPESMVRRLIRNKYIELDGQVFEDDYNRWHVEEETKPMVIGSPFLKKKFFRSRGVILVHGYMAAPEEIRPLADFLHRNGYWVYGARLEGHGTSPNDLASKTWPDWYESVNRAYVIMKNQVKTFAICGFSTGAILSLLQAANKPGRFAGVISINGPLRLQSTAAKYSPLIVGWNRFLSVVRSRRGKMEFVDNDPENPHINYTRNPVRGVYELERLMRHVRSRLGDVRDPALVIQGSTDPVVNPLSGADIYARLGTQDKQMVQIDADHHGILRGREADEVRARVLQFLKEVFK